MKDNRSLNFLIKEQEGNQKNQSAKKQWQLYLLKKKNNFKIGPWFSNLGKEISSTIMILILTSLLTPAIKIHEIFFCSKGNGS